MPRRRVPFRIPTRVYVVARGLSRAEAMRRALRADTRAGYGDCRGFVYDSATGRAALT